MTRPSPSDPPWELCDLDTGASWPLFQEFRDTPSRERDLTALARSHGLGVRYVARLAAQGQWQARARAYDRHVDREMTRIRLADLRLTTKRHLSVAMGMLEAVSIEIRKLLTDAREGPTVRQLKATEIARLAEVAISFERLVTGESTTNVRDVTDLSRLSEAELLEFKALALRVRRG